VSDLLRPRTVSELVDAAFQLYRQSPIEYITAAALVYIPYLIVRLTAIGSAQSSVEQIFTSLVLSLLMFMVFGLIDAPVMWLASERALGRPAVAADAIRATIGRFPAVLMTVFIRVSMTTVGTFLFIVPGVLLTGLTFGVTQAQVIERLTINKAFDRSFALSGGLKMHVLSTMLLGWLVWFAVWLGAELFLWSFGNAVVREVGTALLSVVVYPILPIVKTMLYYDCRIRREGFDVEWMADSMAPAPAAQT
jgi:hypothetical protein